jgi:hypothetical protein
MNSLIGYSAQIALSGNADLPNRAYIKGMSTIRKLRSPPYSPPAIPEIVASVSRPKALVDVESRLQEMREKHNELAAQLSLMQQSVDDRNRRELVPVIKATLQDKLRLEDEIAAFRRQHSAEGAKYIAAVEKALQPCRAEALTRIAAGWDELISAWELLDEIRKEMSRTGAQFHSGPATAGQLRRLVGPIVEKTLRGSV